MRWRGRRESGNVEDRRGGGGFPGGGGLRFPIGARRGGFGGIGFLLVIVVVSVLLGVNPLTLIEGIDGGPGGSVVERQSDAPAPAPDDEMGRFVAVVLADT